MVLLCTEVSPALGINHALAYRRMGILATP
jgi:hypothetical protein